MHPERLGLLLVGVLAQQAPLLPQASLTPAGNVTTIPSIVVVVTTQTSLTTVRVHPTSVAGMPPGLGRPSPILPGTPPGPPETPPMQQPEQEQQLPCPLDPLLRRMLVSGNYSSAFRIANPSGADDEISIDAVCEANAFCSQRPPGLYCYRPPKRCHSSMLTTASASSQANLIRQQHYQEDCLPVAMIMCPEAIFIGCSDGYACHQVPDAWPWDIPPSQRSALYGLSSRQLQPQASSMVLPSAFGSGYYQVQPNMTNGTQTGGNMTQTQPASTFSAIAHCMAVIREEPAASKIAEAALMPSSSQDWNQWCSYRDQLKASNISVTVGSDCVTRTLPGFKIPASSTSTTCPATESISTVWWWPGIETGAAPFIAKAESTSSLASVDTCIPSPPPTCNGPYPYAPVATSTYLFVSVSTTSIPYTATLTQESVSTVTAPASTITSSFFSTALQTVTAIQTVTAAPTPAIVPEPVLPAKTPATPAAQPPQQPALVPQVPVKTPLTPVSGAVPPELFPSAGEQYEAYTAKIGAIATIL